MNTALRSVDMSDLLRQFLLVCSGQSGDLLYEGRFHNQGGVRTQTQACSPGVRPRSPQRRRFISVLRRAEAHILPVEESLRARGQGRVGQKETYREEPSATNPAGNRGEIHFSPDNARVDTFQLIRTTRPLLGTDLRRITFR